MGEHLEDHTVGPGLPLEGVRYELKPCRTAEGASVPDLFTAWIVLDNPSKLNAYTTPMLKSLLLALGRASHARDVVAVVLTGAGDRSFCTGGDAAHYAEAYAGRPQEFARYLRLFSDVITAILHCDKPVLNRVNGLRIAGGQEFGLACDVSVASDLAEFGQAGPRHGSAPVMGATDFLPLYVGQEWATVACTTAEPWTAYEALRLRLVAEAVPVTRVDGAFVPNPLVITDRWLDAQGRMCHGRRKEGADLEAAKALRARGVVDLAPLDAAVERWVTRWLHTFPGCLAKTLEALRRHKLDLWHRHREGDRLWMAQNMVTEAAAGFRAFAQGTRERRTVDFVELRRRLARGEPFDQRLVDAVQPPRA
ncbi:MAG: enoyl-CoA hydratase-related protein [Planctomycetia bacterium]